MSSTSPTDPGAGAEQTPGGALVDELEGRIEEIDGLDDVAIGHFTGWDWLVCVIGAVVVPAIAMWWFAG